MRANGELRRYHHARDDVIMHIFTNLKGIYIQDLTCVQKVLFQLFKKQKSICFEKTVKRVLK